LDTIFDIETLQARKRRAIALAAPGADFLMARACEDLEDRLGTVERRFERAAALFCHTPHAAQVLVASGKVDAVLRVETATFVPGVAEVVPAAPETVPLPPGELDLAVSILSLHEANDVPGMMVQIRRALRPDGLFLGVVAGAGTLAELRDSLLAAETEMLGGASPRVMPFADVRDIGALLQRAGFALPVADVETVVVRYDHAFALMKDLRAMGATNALLPRSRRPATRALFARAGEIYAERFSDPDGRVRATYSFIWMSGWAPHASQQQPLKPGSARASLAQALNDAGKTPGEG